MMRECLHGMAVGIGFTLATTIVTAQQGSLTPQTTTSQGPASDRSSLIGRWQLERIEVSKDKTVTPPSPENYQVEFFESGSIVARLDCNRARGNYTVTGSSLTIEPNLSTLMACGEVSIAREFTKALQTVTSFRRTADTLLLSMRNSDATMYLKRVP